MSLLQETDYQPAFAEIADVNEDAIHQAAITEWVETVAQLWDVIGKPVDEKRLNVYCKQLQNIPLGLLEIGINYAISNNTYSTVAPVGKIFEGIRKELVGKLNLPAGMDMDDMIDRWMDAKARACFYSFG